MNTPNDPDEPPSGEVSGSRPPAAAPGVAEDVHRRGEEALHESEERFRLLIETTSEWIWVMDLAGHHTFTNPAGCTILGLDQDRFLEGDAFELLHEDDRPLAQRVFAEAVARRRGWSGVVLRWRHRDGTYRHLESTAVPLFDRNGNLTGFQGADHDITERVRAERERDRLFRLSVDLLCVAGFDGWFKQVNPAWTRTLGWSESELTARPWLDFVHPDDRAATIAADARLLQGGPVFTFENRYRCKDGTYRWLSWNAFPLPEESLIFSVVRDITVQRQSEESARARQALLASVFRAAPSGIGVVENRRLLEVNDRVCEMTGYTRDELVGQSARILYPTQEEFEFVGREKYRQISLSGTGTVETCWRRKDGRIIDVLLSSTPIEAGNLSGQVTFTATDISSRRRMEQSLRESEERHRLLFNLESDAIVVVDSASGQVLEVNQAAERLYGHTRDEWLALKNADVSAEPDKTRQAVLDKVSSVPTRWHRKKDGTVFPVEITASHFEMNGRPVYMVAIRDITDRLRAEEERRRLETQVQQAQKLESLGVLAGGIAHDFNNLLTAILGHANLALADIAPESPARESLQEIERASCRAAELCRQMLAYAGRSRIVVEPVNLSRLIQELTHLLRVSISKKAILHCQLAEDLPAIEADPVQMRQVAMNLVINASEAIGDNEGVISVSTGVAECSEADLRGGPLTETPPPGRYVFLEVTDSGCGMTADTCARIFDPFFTTKFTGRGLGLAAVLGIVRKHGGALKVESEPGKGTSFRIVVPASAKPVATTEEGVASRLWRGAGTVLLVDDEDAVRGIGAKMLERCGFKVMFANDGRQAVEVFRQYATEIACVLLDLKMPRMDGEETFEHLRRLNPAVRVILASGYSDDDVNRRLADKGVAGFIEKPYNLQALNTKLREVLNPAAG